MNRTTRSLKTRRGILETLTIANLRQIAQKYGIILKANNTKTGIISALMRQLPKSTIMQEASMYN